MSIRTTGDVVGSYDSLFGLKEIVSIEVEGGRLYLRANRAERYAVEIRQDGALSIPGHNSATLFRRGTRTLLYIGWAYRYGLYERRR